MKQYGVQNQERGGHVDLQEIPAGQQNISVEAPGYIPGEFEVTIEEGKAEDREFYLQRVPPDTGYCKGTVKNKDGTPLIAGFIAQREGVEPFSSNPVTGAFGVELSPGTHEFYVKVETYLPQKLRCEIERGKTHVIDIVMLKPDKPVIVEDEIVLSDVIYFAYNRALIKKRSYNLLNDIAELINSRPDVEKIRIEGHTDSLGRNAYNEELSLRRANAIRDYLIDQGVDPEKLLSVGFGETKPVSTNLTDEGRAENRRVEFNIVDEEQ